MKNMKSGLSSKSAYFLVIALLMLLVSACSDTPSTSPTLELQGEPNDIALSSLTTSIDGFPGGFSPEVLSYAASAAPPTVTISAISRSEYASMTLFFGSGSSVTLKSDVTSQPITLNVGANVIAIKIAGKDRSISQIYTLTINKSL